MERNWIPSRIICFTSLMSTIEKPSSLGIQAHMLYSNCGGYIVDCYEMGIYEVDSYEWSTILDIMLTLYINCGITLVMVNNEACPTYLFPLLESTCSMSARSHVL